MLEDIIIYTPMYVTFMWAIILLLTYHQHNKAKFFLGIFMVAAFLLYLSHAVFFHKNIAAYSYFDPVYILTSLSVYPLYYWYIKLLTVETTIRLYNLRLLIPAILLSAVSFMLYLFMDGNERIAYIQGFLLHQNPVLLDSLWIKLQKMNFYATRIVFAFQVIFFLTHAKKLVSAYNSQLGNFYSNLEQKNMRWVNVFLYSFIATALVSTFFNVIGRSLFLNSPLLLLIPSVIFSILLFLIGYIGSLQNHTVIDLKRDSISHVAGAIKRFSTDQLAQQLSDLFATREVYRNSDLKITDVAQTLGTNRTYISELINSEFSCSFVEFVNRYRFNEAKRLLQETNQATLSLQEVSERAGFGSAGTFIRIFRQFEGTTPGRYREQLLRSPAKETQEI